MQVKKRIKDKGKVDFIIDFRRIYRNIKEMIKVKEEG